MWHTTCTYIFQGDSWLLVGGSKIGTMIPNLFFGHNLSFKYLDESCKFILDISKTFNWYKEIFNLTNFDPLKYFFEDLRLHRDSNSESENPLGNVWINSLTLSRVKMWLPGYTLNPHLSMFLPWLQAQG